MDTGIPLHIINTTANDVMINYITEFGDEFFWSVEEMPTLPYTLSANDTLTLVIICAIPTSSNGFLIDDEMFVETTLDTYVEHIMIDSDLLSQNENILLDDKIDVYPNPSSDRFNFSFNNNEDSQVLIQIFDIKGNKIIDEITDVLSSNENIISISTVDYGIKSGTYFYKITSDTYSKSGKLIKID